MTRFLHNPGTCKAQTLLAGLAVILAWNFPANAQNLELFEDIERTASATSRSTDSPAETTTVSLTEPEFTLVGASRIGDRRQVVLTHRGGQTLTVPLTAEGNAPVPGHEQFRVIASEGGRVAIQYPAGSNCVESTNQGVSCDTGANIAWLSLRPAPLPADIAFELSEADAQDAQDKEEEPVSEEEAAEVAEELARDPNNPFARLRAEALGQDVPPAPRFRPRRIDPNQVPPGMRVVSTPFGDRLVEID